MTQESSKFIILGNKKTLYLNLITLSVLMTLRVNTVHNSAKQKTYSISWKYICLNYYLFDFCVNKTYHSVEHGVGT